MNIGIFTDTYYPEINGVASSTYELKRGLEKLGHSVYIFTVTNPAAPQQEKQVYRITSVPFPMLKERRIGVTLPKLWGIWEKRWPTVWVFPISTPITRFMKTICRIYICQTSNASAESYKISAGFAATVQMKLSYQRKK